MSCEGDIEEKLPGKPVNTFRAVRQFERMMSPGFRMDGTHHPSYNPPHVGPIDSSDKLIVKITHDLIDHTIKYERVPIDQPQEEKL